MDIVDSLREIADGKRAGVKVMPFAATIHDAADEIERMREALEKVLSVQPIKGDEGSTDIIALAKALLEIDSIARAALKEKE